MSAKKLSPQQVEQFQFFIWQFYKEQGRPFAWRETKNPYHILVSEIMLQQTQTHRVAPKYELFISEFPDFQSLAQAGLRDLLSAWQGLGYNRRALALQKTAQKVMNEFGGQLPDDPEVLVTFSGIGPNTAGSICAFAFNKPVVFIETNIRTVFIHLFFKDRDEVHDKELLPLIEQTLDYENPREWYYALMDYGVFLKKQLPNPSRKSKHHTKQSKFEGSDRQIRGMILRLLTRHSHMPATQLADATKKESRRVNKILLDLEREGFIKKQNNRFSIL